MGESFLFSFLIGDEHGLSCVARKKYGTTLACDEILLGDLLPIDERERKAVGEETKFLYQIERERRSARPQHMQETDLWIKPRCFNG